jgi:thymidylate kinase
MLTKFLIFDGVDEVGKSTFIEMIKMNPQCKDKVVELNFPKLLPSGTLLRINDEKSFELLFSVFDYLDPKYTYILDRFITSNLVYDKVLRSEDVSVSMHYWAEFMTRFNVKQYLFTRPEIQKDFVDDKIKLSRDQFNGCIAEYKKYGTNHMLLQRNSFDMLIGVDMPLKHQLIDEIAAFVNGTV